MFRRVSQDYKGWIRQVTHGHGRIKILNAYQQDLEGSRISSRSIRISLRMSQASSSNELHNINHHELTLQYSQGTNRWKMQYTFIMAMWVEPTEKFWVPVSIIKKLYKRLELLSITMEKCSIACNLKLSICQRLKLLMLLLKQQLEHLIRFSRKLTELILNPDRLMASTSQTSMQRNLCS